MERRKTHYSQNTLNTLGGTLAALTAGPVSAGMIDRAKIPVVANVDVRHMGSLSRIQ